VCSARFRAADLHAPYNPTCKHPHFCRQETALNDHMALCMPAHNLCGRDWNEKTHAMDYVACTCQNEKHAHLLTSVRMHTYVQIRRLYLLGCSNGHAVFLFSGCGLRMRWQCREQPKCGLQACWVAERASARVRRGGGARPRWEGTVVDDRPVNTKHVA
jgi:hypothetical protein